MKEIIIPVDLLIEMKKLNEDDLKILFQQMVNYLNLNNNHSLSKRKYLFQGLEHNASLIAIFTDFIRRNSENNLNINNINTLPVIEQQTNDSQTKVFMRQTNFMKEISSNEK